MFDLLSGFSRKQSTRSKLLIKDPEPWKERHDGLSEHANIRESVERARREVREARERSEELDRLRRAQQEAERQQLPTLDIDAMESRIQTIIDRSESNSANTRDANELMRRLRAITNDETSDSQDTSLSEMTTRLQSEATQRHSSEQSDERDRDRADQERRIQALSERAERHTERLRSANAAMRRMQNRDELPTNDYTRIRSQRERERERERQRAMRPIGQMTGIANDGFTAMRGTPGNYR
ncbi:unnamed protein product, partial [marine sediment metagenome]